MWSLLLQFTECNKEKSVAKTNPLNTSDGISQGLPRTKPDIFLGKVLKQTHKTFSLILQKRRK